MCPRICFFFSKLQTWQQFIVFKNKFGNTYMVRYSPKRQQFEMTRESLDVDRMGLVGFLVQTVLW